MRYIDGFREGMHISDVYLCKSKQIALTKNGKEYGNLVLQDKTGTVDAKLWDLGSPGVGNFEALDYVYIDADVTMFMGAKQLNVKRIRKADEGEYIPADYLPVSLKDVKQMYSELLALIASFFSTVTPGQLPTYWFAPVRALNMVVLPQFGFPASAILIAIFSSLSFLVVVMLCG